MSIFKTTLASIFCITVLCQIAIGQVTTRTIQNINVSSSKAELLGKTKTVRASKKNRSTTPKIKKERSKIEKMVPDNFKGRRNQSKAVHLDKEHQGPDPIRQSEVNKRMGNEIEVLANVMGRGSGSPTDPTGDVNSQYYVQAVNATEVGVYNLDGSLEEAFAMNLLWDGLNVSSAGDPIILFDEIANRWFLTEFTDPANVLIAVSDTDDPLGSYNAYNFSTPNFPDYPKYSITTNHLMITTNERGGGELHHYFLDKAALLAGDDEVAFQRIEIEGTDDSEQGFYVATPVDLNGPNAPFDDRPISMRLNDSSWPGGPAEDQIELYKFDIDFENSNNTTVEQTSIVVSPYDAFPCSESGFGFQCIPQLNGQGLDGIPEIIMNLPHQRNFGSHESIVLTFVTDVTDGQNFAGVRWMELRRTADTDWDVYQEGTYSPDDGLERFMSTAAIDSKGNICLGYSVSSTTTFAGLRATGRRATDPLGTMTYDEVILAEGMRAINSGGRFGDYAQMSVAPEGKSEFWFTSEYAAANGTRSNIAGLSLQRDSFDLAVSAFITPNAASFGLSNTESVTIEITNSGINPIPSYTLGLILDGAQVDMMSITNTIQPDENLQHTFNTPLDLSEIMDYGLTAFVTAPTDDNPLNDTLSTTIQNLPSLEASLTGSLEAIGCDQSANGIFTLTNLGGDIITDAVIGITVNGVPQDDITYKGSLSFEQSREFDVSLDQNVMVGGNEIAASITSINSTSNDFDASNNELNLTVQILDESEFVLVQLTTDEYPEETSYEITNPTTGTVLFSADDFEDEETVYNQMVCVAEGGCFTLTLFDSYGDGICCNFGEGSIAIFDNQGNIIAANNGNFGNQVQIEFCNNPGECNLGAEIDVTQSSSSSSSDGTIMVAGINGVGPYQYSLDGGASLQNSGVFSSLSPGDYEVYVLDLTTNCDYAEMVSVDFGTSTYFVGDATVQVDIIPNPTSGVFQIKVNDPSSNSNFVEIEIFDINGKLIQQRQIGKYDNEFVGTFSLYAYPAGNYLVRVKGDRSNFLERIVKQ